MGSTLRRNDEKPSAGLAEFLAAGTVRASPCVPTSRAVIVWRAIVIIVGITALALGLFGVAM